MRYFYIGKMKYGIECGKNIKDRGSAYVQKRINNAAFFVTHIIKTSPFLRAKALCNAPIRNIYCLGMKKTF